MSGDCPKCGKSLSIGGLDDEISYVRVVLLCDGRLEKLCDFKEVREIDVEDIREYGTLVEEDD